MCLQQLGELQKKLRQFEQAGAQVIGISVDSGAQAVQVVQTTGATFPILTDADLNVTRQYDMQLRPEWPMGGMGPFPEMGFVVVDGKGMIRAQRVELEFGDTLIQLLKQIEDLQ